MGKFLRQLPLLFLAILLPYEAYAETNYHAVGWFNLFVPGGGQFLLGHPIFGATQAALEVGTFAAGYSNSKRTPFSLDGVPEELPGPAFQSVPVVHKVCRKVSGVTKCTTSTSFSSPLPPVDITRALYADWLQEFGIKYHFVNVFNSYREAAKSRSLGGTQKIDQSSTLSLFLAPFNPKYLFMPAVALGVIVTAAALVYSFNDLIQHGGITPLIPMNRRSSDLYTATYLGVFPVGSAAPEEMFYRGFLQGELYAISGTGFVSVPISTTAYAFSHSSDDRPSAAVSGLFLGMLTHANHGALAPAIAYHFWADVLAGLYQLSIVRKEMGSRPIVDLEVKF